MKLRGKEFGMIELLILAFTAFLVFVTFKCIKKADKMDEQLLEDQAYYDRLMGTRE